MSKSRTKVQKIIQIGNSAGVTLDYDFLHQNSLKVGDAIQAQYSSDDGSIFLTPPPTSTKSEPKLSKAQQKTILEAKVNEEFRQWVEKSLKEDEESLTILANT